MTKDPKEKRPVDSVKGLFLVQRQNGSRDARFRRIMDNIPEQSDVFTNKATPDATSLIGSYHVVQNIKNPTRQRAGTQLVVHIQEANRSPILVLQTVTRLKNEGNKGTSQRSRQGAGGQRTIKNLNQVMPEDVPESGVKLHGQAVRTWRFIAGHTLESSMDLTN